MATSNILMDVLVRKIDSIPAVGFDQAIDQTPNISVLLSVIRVYSHWSLANSKFLGVEVLHDSLHGIAKRFWSTYSRFLQLIATRFPVKDLPVSQYQFEEDVDCTGFLPVDTDVNKGVWFHADGRAKDKFNDRRVTRESIRVEIRGKMRDLQLVGLRLAAQEVCLKRN